MHAFSWAKPALLAAGLLAGSGSMAFVPSESGAGHRYVTVNGLVLGPQELAMADANAGFVLPDGHYWYDMASGYWGAVGGPALGRVAAQPQAQQGWSWRNDSNGDGMIYNPDGSSWQDRVRIEPD
jgi:hypothetical protein